jgi:hypothetical protein
VTGLVAGDTAAAGLGDSLGDAAELAGEVFSMVRSYRVARVHQVIWQHVFARLAAGESAPFSTSESSTPTTTAKRSPRGPRKEPSSNRRATSASKAPKGPRLRQALAELVQEDTGLPAEHALIVLEVLAEQVTRELIDEGRSRVHPLGTFVRTSRSVSFHPSSSFRRVMSTSR